MSVSPRCIWTNRPDEGTREIVVRAPRARAITVFACPQHEAQVRAHHERLEQGRTGFLVAVVVVLLLAPFSVLLEPDLGVGLLLGVLGIALVVYPFATPYTVQSNGIARSVQLVRGFGIACIVAGLAFLMLWVLNA